MLHPLTWIQLSAAHHEQLPRIAVHNNHAHCSLVLQYAWKLGVRHPVSGQKLEFEAPLPDDMVGLVGRLREEHLEAARRGAGKGGADFTIEKMCFTIRKFIICISLLRNMFH